MVSFTCQPQELQQVKDALRRDPFNLGVGILHEPTGVIFLAPFDSVPGGHSELVSNWRLAQSECKGFVISLKPDGAFGAVNASHLNGPQGQPGSLQMPQVTFDAIVDALVAADL